MSTPSCHDVSACAPMYGPESCGSSCCHLASAEGVEPTEEGLRELYQHHQAVIARLENDLLDVVLRMRENGLSWRDVGRAIGISRQAAWERFSRMQARRVRHA